MLRLELCHWPLSALSHVKETDLPPLAGLSPATTRSWEGLNEPVSVPENILGARQPVQGQHRPAAGALQGAAAGAGLTPRAVTSSWSGHWRLSGPSVRALHWELSVVSKYIFLPEMLMHV